MSIGINGVDRTLPVNILRGIVPIASGWGTDPTNLANCTDGDASTATGTGSTVKDAAGSYGYIVFDLGSIKHVLVSARIGQWSSASSTASYWGSSDDNITYRDSTIGTGTVAKTSITTTSEIVLDSYGAVLTGQYIRIRCYTGAASTAYAKFYEVVVYELRF